MTDQWGRTTFDDGMNIARGVMAIDSSNQAKAKTKIEEDAYKGFELLKNDSAADLSAFDSKSNYLAHKMVLDESVSKSTAKINEMQMTTEGMKQTVQQMKVAEAQDQQDKKLAFAALASGDESAFKTHARKIFNRAPNGVVIKEGENGKITKTDLAGKSEDVDDLSVDQYKDMMGTYFEMDPDEKIKARVANKQIIQAHNQEVINKGEPMMNDNGDTIYRIPSGTRDPKTGEVRGTIYIRDIDDQEPMPESEAKGYKRMPEELRDLYLTLGREPTDEERQITAGTREKMKSPTASSSSASTLEKEATFLAKAYGVPVDEALNMVRTDDQLAQLLKAYNSELETKTAWESDPQVIAEAEKAARKKYGLDEYFEQRTKATSQQTAQDVVSEIPDEMGPTAHQRSPMQASGGQSAQPQGPQAQPAQAPAQQAAQPLSGQTASAQQETPPVEGAVKAKDGNWYVQDPQTGKWNMVQITQ